MNKKLLYWSFQLGGWTFFILLQILFYKLSANSITNQAIIYFSLGYFLGILLTHLFRAVILQFSWLSKSLFFQIAAVLLGSFLLAGIFEAIQHLVLNLLFSISFNLEFTELIQNLLNTGFIFILWNLIYFSFYYFEKYRKSEIENLKFQFSMNEIELNKLKSQLNPHFMFNAMNSIRALIDEDPNRAKEAVTMLSNILRTTLQMEKNKLISFEEELSIVRDYLELEHIRFEKRLSYSLQFSEESKTYMIPTMMIQTLVENGIKHGISKLVDGGTISLNASVENNKVKITISNPGELSTSTGKDGGTGLKNTRQRLELLFGKEGSFDIYQHENFVISEINLPKIKKEDNR